MTGEIAYDFALGIGRLDVKLIGVELEPVTVGIGAATEKPRNIGFMAWALGRA